MPPTRSDVMAARIAARMTRENSDNVPKGIVPKGEPGAVPVPDRRPALAYAADFTEAFAMGSARYWALTGSARRAGSLIRACTWCPSRIHETAPTAIKATAKPPAMSMK